MNDPLPWWQSELEALETSLRKQLRWKLPALRQHHDDLVNDTLEGLIAHIGRSDDVPVTWSGETAPPQQGRDAYYRLAHTILNRRVTDLIRKRSPTLIDPVSIDEMVPEVESDSREQRIDMIRLLQLCMELVGRLADDERRLIHEVASGGAAPLSPRERQQLRRIRVRLRETIEGRLGQSIADLLGG